MATGSDPVDPKWTAVEPGLPTRVRALATQLTAAAPTRYDAVSAVDGYLQTHEIYDLTSPVPAPGQDAVDDFLFVTHRGFCEQFASAAVIMLRSTGIPARLVTGYSKGDLTSEPGERIMRGTDAHAWIQVWYPGVGWVTSDPTAAATVPPPLRRPRRLSAAPDRHPLPLAAALQIMPGGRVGWLVAFVSLLAVRRARECSSVSSAVADRRQRFRSLPRNRDLATAQSCRRTCASTRRWVGRHASPNRPCARWRAISTQRVARARKLRRRWIVSSVSVTRSCRPLLERSRLLSTCSTACTRHYWCHLK